ncbi:hypothetical protein BDBG_17104 [Blastomyces gilchristii SLH14081]|uniref:Uncharacterized protein n=1 Tax=Blastomyces gilchristii (strain SLH14081) TaxID=559298 RepID=A0A179UQP6_BLAGS|nr:uncharacterized protein BDBG_17104 [Blastomyces gilchristii SLH14081]OAT08732.1 hypothetical protein BDBG_17104 [Blastomyces gilchristii SLH14081]
MAIGRPVEGTVSLGWMDDYEKEDERSEKAEKMTDEEEGEGEWTLVVDDEVEVEVEVEDGDGDGDGRREKENGKARQGRVSHQSSGMLVYRLLIARIGKTERALETDQTNNHACARGLSPPKVPKVACYPVSLARMPAYSYLHTCMLFLLDREVSIILF